MAGTVECDHCGGPIVWLKLYNGHNRAFDPGVRDGKVASTVQRWYMRRDRIAFPQDMITMPEDANYIVAHVCGRGREVKNAFGDASTSALDRARTTGPFVTDRPIVSSVAAYTFRWQSNWAHISVYPYQALCGSRMPDGIRTSSRDREQLKRMPVCPTCWARYEQRQEWAERQAAEAAPAEPAGQEPEPPRKPRRARERSLDGLGAFFEDLERRQQP